MSTLRAYLQLLRLPAVFTAMADVFMGFLLSRRVLAPAGGFLTLLAASSCLYLAGMAFNDVFDRKTDAVERPHRPIPSGRVSLRAATILGGLLALCGLAAAFFAGWQSLLVAALLAVCIFLYDGLLKSTPLGPPTMGACRLLNVLLGASFLDAHAAFGVHLSLSDPRIAVLARPQLPVAICMGIYVAGVTWFARQEARVSRRGHLLGASAVINCGLAGLAAIIAGVPGLLRPWTPPGDTDPRAVLMALAVIALILNRRLAGAILDPVPGKVQPAVKTLLLSIIMLDAVLVFFHTNSPGYATMTAALVVPALLLGRWVYVT